MARGSGETPDGASGNARQPAPEQGATLISVSGNAKLPRCQERGEAQISASGSAKFDQAEFGHVAPEDDSLDPFAGEPGALLWLAESDVAAEGEMGQAPDLVDPVIHPPGQPADVDATAAGSGKSSGETVEVVVPLDELHEYLLAHRLTVVSGTWPRGSRQPVFVTETVPP